MEPSSNKLIKKLLFHTLQCFLFQESQSANFITVETISNINPYGILIIFLPILIFESGFNADWHIFRKQFGQTFILAFPCVLAGSIIIMFSLKVVLGYSEDYYSWPGAFMFGSILSCTDTVAVLALLKEIGAPKKFNSLIEGESLLNDGSCMVLFVISSELVKAHPITFIDIIQLFFSLTFGGVLLGVLFGLVSTYWIRRIFNDGILVVNITVISCYLVYFIAQNMGVRISGIIALVSLGLYMAAFGKTRISSEAQSYVQGFWSYAVFCAQTTIFILAGVLVGTKVFTITGNIQRSDFYKLLGLYVCMIAARFLSIAIFMRVLPKLGYGLSWKEVYVLTYGGLRGAIGISFSLIVFNDVEYSQKLRDIILFDMAGNVILTLLINGTTTGPFVKWLGLSSVTKINQKLYIKFIQRLLDQVDQKKNEMSVDSSYLEEISWKEVEQNIGKVELEKLRNRTLESIGKTNQQKISKRRKKTEFQDALHETLLNLQYQDQQNRQRFEQQTLIKDERQETLMQIRSKFLMALKTQYWQFNQTNNTSAQATVILLEAANWDLDSHNIEINSCEWIKNHISNTYIHFLLNLRTRPIVGSFARNYLFNYLAYSYDILSSFIEAQQHVREKAKDFETNQALLKVVFQQSISNQKEAQDYLQNYLNASFPEISREIQTKKASFNLLQYSKNILNRYLGTGQIDMSQYTLLKSKIDKRVTKLEMHSPKWNMKPFLDTFHENQVFSTLPDNMINALENDVAIIAFDIEQSVIKKGSQAKYVYIIRRGSLTLIDGNQKYILGTSEIFGFEALISKTYCLSAIANTVMIIHPIKVSNWIKLINSFPEFQIRFWKRYFNYMVLMFGTKDKLLNKLIHLNDFKNIIQSFKLIKLEAGKRNYKIHLIFLRDTNSLENEVRIFFIKKNTDFTLPCDSWFFSDPQDRLESHIHLFQSQV